MSLSTKPYKGTRDFYPEQMRLRKWLFSRIEEVLERFGYEAYDAPMLEPFELYAAKTGEEIVNEQLYWLKDRHGRKLALRPEMTPSLARMVSNQLQELPRPIRWYSIPNLWRYERPQRGRLREHWQVNVDVLGGERVLGDWEILNLILEVLRAFGGEDKIRVHLNHRALMDHFFKQSLGLEEADAQQAMKLIDAKDKMGQERFTAALTDLGLSAEQQDKLHGFLNASLQDIQEEREGMDQNGASELKTLFSWIQQEGLEDQFVFDPTVVRGMDYYTGTVFEVYDRSPENKRAMFGGGRYDHLLSLFGQQELSGVGFGMGDVTLENFLKTHELLPEMGRELHALVTLPDWTFRPTCERIARNLREKGLKVMTPLSVKKLSQQLKQANRHQASYAIILGSDELERGEVTLKNMSTGEQETVPENDLASVLQKAIG